MAFNFTAQKWDLNITADKACQELFKKIEKVKKHLKTPTGEKGHAASNKEKNSVAKVHLKTKKKKGFKKKENLKTNFNKVETNKSQNLDNVNNAAVKHKMDNVSQKKNKKHVKPNSFMKKEDEKITDAKIGAKVNMPVKQGKAKKLNLPITKQSKNPKFQSKAKLIYQSGITRKQKMKMSLRERMLLKLKGAQFRYLNEQMYTTTGTDSKKYFEHNPDDYRAYHEGYRQQVTMWPLNPLDIIIAKINKMPTNYIIADFGCGDAQLAKSVPQKVHSFDLIAVDDSVTACDMSRVPLKNSSIDVAVFCLSLMGTNLKDYIREAARVLKAGGMLKIAEVESRFDNIETFIQNIQKYGFVKAKKDLSHDLFWFLDFIKKDSNIQKQKLPDIHLNPCLYKKR